MRPRLAEILVDSGDGEGALLRGRALEAVFVGEAESLDGVSRAHVALVGRRSAPAARAVLVLEAHASCGGVARATGGEALAHARDSAGLAELLTEVRLRGSSMGRSA